MKYDSIIIGAGLSGLAAGIRLSHFGKKVLIIESHSIAGGLNSYYTRSGRSIDVGLHAMTNFCPAGTRNTPLTKLLRQLRIKHKDLGLVEQDISQIDFPGNSLSFSNDINILREEISKTFPDELSGFDRLRTDLKDFDSTAFENKPESTLSKLSDYIEDRRLIDMLLCPIMFYGNAREDDMNWAEFAVMWDSLYESGFSRPEKGMKYIIDLLVDKYQKNLGELRFNTKATKISKLPNGDIVVELEGGEELTTTQVYSSARLVETSALCGIDRHEDTGKIGFSELVLYLDKSPKELGCNKSIIFYSTDNDFKYRRTDKLVDTSSGVICIPNNFDYPEDLEEGIVRVSVKSSFSAWDVLDKEAYRSAKAEAIREMIKVAEAYMPDIKGHITLTDMFTPTTVTKYTGHFGGAIYGSPTKIRDAKLAIDGVYLIGTDQGFLGIVGALLSGISVVNRYGLK